MENGVKSPKVLVILGSSREDSNTLKAIRKFVPYKDYQIVDLRNLYIRQHDYDHSKLQGDDFLKIAYKMLDADIIYFSTPVYWYSMSTLMKTFFDRLSELLSTHKPIGKALKGKQTYLIVSSGSNELPEGFEVPFRRTSEYFKMNFGGTYFQWDGELS